MFPQWLSGLKNSPAMQDAGLIPGQDEILEQSMATPSSILA